MEMRPLATRVVGGLIAALLPLLFAALGASAPVVHGPADVIENLSAAKWGPAPPMSPARCPNRRCWQGAQPGQWGLAAGDWGAGEQEAGHGESASSR
jgi:hypothetical protein